jgi:hypothetical protein
MCLPAKRVASLLRRAALTAIAMAVTGVAHSQQIPNGANQDIQNRRQIDAINNQPSRDQAQAHAQVAKFIEAIKSRKEMYPDFDKVVLHGNAPVTPSMLCLMSESPYAADIAYYLGQHPEQSGAIAKMPPEQARSAIKQIEAAAAATNPIRK